MATRMLLLLMAEAREHLLLAQRRLDEIERMVDGSREPAASEQWMDERVELTEREWDVLRLVAAGRSDKQIGAALGIKVSTVRTHLEHAMKKLQVDSRVDLAAWSMRADGRPAARHRIPKNKERHPH